MPGNIFTNYTDTEIVGFAEHQTEIINDMNSGMVNLLNEYDFSNTTIVRKLCEYNGDYYLVAIGLLKYNDIPTVIKNAQVYKFDSDKSKLIKGMYYRYAEQHEIAQGNAIPLSDGLFLFAIKIEDNTQVGLNLKHSPIVGLTNQERNTKKEGMLIQKFLPDNQHYNQFKASIQNAEIVDEQERVGNIVSEENGAQNHEMKTVEEEKENFARNIIISGPPGVGKSYFVHHNIAATITGLEPKLGKEDNLLYKERIERITFTPSVSYEDFFGCYKPLTINVDEKGVEVKEDGDQSKISSTKVIYRFLPGAFCRVLKKALLNPQKNYVLIVEELNRAEVYDVFGQVFQLLDRNEFGESEYDIGTPSDASDFFEKAKEEWRKAHPTDSDQSEKMPTLLEQSDKKLQMPSNLYIICTMNSADQNVSMLDTAFKRRFDFVYIDIDGNAYMPKRTPIQEVPFSTRYSLKIHNDFGYIRQEQFDKYRTWINNAMRAAKPAFSEDKMISINFIKTYQNEDTKKVSSEPVYDAMDFVVKILGYLIQDVYRVNGDLSTLLNKNAGIFIDGTNKTSLFKLMSQYCEIYKEESANAKETDELLIDEKCIEKILLKHDK